MMTNNSSKRSGQVIADVVLALQSVMQPENIATQKEILDEYSHDAWPVSALEKKMEIHQFRPDIVVTPKSKKEILGVLKVAKDNQVPIMARGLGSSVTGQSLATQGGIVLDLSKIVSEPVLSISDMTVSASAGMRGSDLEEWLNKKSLTMNFFPQSLSRSTIGGWVATRATGQLSTKFGGIEESAVGFSVILSDSTEIQVGQKPRAAVGPNLKELFLGTEGMFAVITEVTLKVYRKSEIQLSEAWLMPSVNSGIVAMREIMQSGIRPSLVRFYDEAEAQFAVPGIELNKCVLFLTHEGLSSITKAEHLESSKIVESSGGVSIGSVPVDNWYKRRFDFSAVENILASKGGYAETIEVAHSWSEIENLYSRLVKELTPLSDTVLGHFSHVYTNGASLYIILLGKTDTDEQAVLRLRKIWDAAMTVVTELGGEISHHHGAGLARQDFIAKSLGTQHELLRKLKNVVDPEGILNPGHLGL
jgi:alkyldihydroxyacetonephosphate synthase